MREKAQENSPYEGDRQDDAVRFLSRLKRVKETPRAIQRNNDAKSTNHARQDLDQLFDHSCGLRTLRISRRKPPGNKRIHRS